MNVISSKTEKADRIDELENQFQYWKEKEEIFEELKNIISDFNISVSKKFGLDSAQELASWEILADVEDKFLEAQSICLALKKEKVQLRREIRENDTQK